MAAGNDFIGLCAKLPQEQLAQADAIKVHLYGSLSATGKGHGTDRAAAGLLGHNPEECKAEFLDNLCKARRHAHRAAWPGQDSA